MKKVVQIILLSILVLGGITAIIFWSVNQKIKVIEADSAKTENLDPKIKALFPTYLSIENYSYEPASINWGNNYLLLKKQYTEESSVIYDTEWNTALGTESNFPGVSCKGIIVSSPNLVVEGNYENSFGGKVGTASRHNYLLYYLDIDKKTILAIDTILGGDPPQRSNSNSGHDAGDPPQIQEAMKSIKKRLP